MFQHAQTFQQTQMPLVKGEYEQCEFNGCDLSNTDLSGYEFVECRFTDCNLSLVNLQKTGLKNVQFKDCKIMGVHFEKAHDFLFEVFFHQCQLSHSSFYGIKMKKTGFENCIMHEVDFTGADLSLATFKGCDLTHAKFYHTNLQKADFSTAINYSIHPEDNQLKKAKFSMEGLPGLLQQYGIEII